MGEIRMKLRAEYTEADRQLFAAYAEVRAKVRPAECSGGLDCWVEFGPPAIKSGGTEGGHCRGCDGLPIVRLGRPSR
jgi:hypothetical protein